MMLNRCEEAIARAKPCERVLSHVADNEHTFIWRYRHAQHADALETVWPLTISMDGLFSAQDAVDVAAAMRDMEFGEHFQEVDIYTVPWQLPAELIEDHRGEGSGLGLAVVGSLLIWSVIVGFILWR